MMSKRICAVVCAAALFLCLAGCGGRASHYRAVGCVHTNTDSNAALSFFEFEGTMVYKLKLKDKSEGDIKYTAELESGNVTVSYEYVGTEAELFRLTSGEKLDSSGGYIEKGTVYIIIKTEGKCTNGSFKFSIN